jgi:hypothetical protein
MRKAVLQERKERQRKAMEAMAKKQASFAAKFEDENDDDEPSVERKSMTECQNEPDFNLLFADFNETAPTCIICSLGENSKSSGPLCMLSYAQRSKRICQASQPKTIMHGWAINTGV